MANNKKAEWRKLSEVIVYDDRVKVSKKKFELPDGEIREYSIVKGRNNVEIVAITNDQKIIVIEQYRTGPEKFLSNLPGGGIDAGETPEQAALRELTEETGYNASNAILLSTSYMAPTREGTYSIVIAEGCKKVSEPRESEKQLGKLKELSIKEFEEYLTSTSLTVFDVAAGYAALAFLKGKK